MIELSLNKIQKYYGANMILEDITFDVQSSEKVGIVGGNGCGKSSLLKIIMGIEEYEKGNLSIRKGASLAYLEQIPNYPENFKVLDVLNTAFEELDKTYKELEILEKELSEVGEGDMDKLLDKYAKKQALYESLGGYEKEEKLNKVCTGLKINDNFKEKLFSQLSGGEKTTIILAKILLQNPDILLLDEPSNHLDLDTMEWLEAYLKEYKGIVIIVSHDRYFLDNVVTKIIEIEDKKSKTYSGNYSAYVKEKERLLQLQMEEYLNQQKKIKSMEKSIAQLRDWGARGDNGKFFRRAASMEKFLNKMEKLDKPRLEKNKINISIKNAERSGNEVIIVKDLCKRYDDKVLLDKAQMLIRNGEAVALIGANGSGKSTMIKILLGLEKADSGIAALGSSIKLGYLPQNIIFNNENTTILESFRENIVITEGKAREYLAKYMFFGEDVFKKVGSLSGGERSRLKLAMLMYEDLNLLILDEPTNHLDIDSREELESFLKDFEGTLLFVSHDRYFINNLASRVVELDRGSLISYEGNYEYYKYKREELRKSSVINFSNNIESLKSKNKSKDIKKNKSNYEAKAVNKWKIAKLEDEIKKLEERVTSLEEEINKFSNNYEKLNELYNEKLNIENEIEKLMEEYFNLTS
ncbi:ribosomal protection-like ABC-F family protein [Clostridium isatidis]|uniref:ribosomal protection-like ABC-F family protein n=1 Tax=Clostridium isatidis TaxID=182773 RepID=UPI003AAAF9F8